MIIFIKIIIVSTCEILSLLMMDFFPIILKAYILFKRINIGSSWLEPYPMDRKVNPV